MCGVLGFFSPDPEAHHMETLMRLFRQSSIRGLHAFGFSTWEKDQGMKDNIRTFKSHHVNQVVEELHKYRITPPSTLIGHTRYSTSGDWQHHSNNQPVHVPGISMVFNGVISQARREEYEKTYDKIYQTDNDGEIFSRKVLDGENWQSFVSDGSFSFAGLFLREGKMFAIRNKRRPLWFSVEAGKAVFIASTEDIFKRAAGFKRVYPFPVGEAFEINEEFLCKHSRA